MMATRSLPAALLLFLSPFVAAEWAVGQEVLTSSGAVAGHAASLFEGVSEYLGIPFAAPPVGELRFMPPQPYARSKKTIVASKFGSDCPTVGAGRPTHSTGNPTAALAGNVVSTFSQAGHVFNEDCLTLNIWTKPQTGEKKKAVLVWIYGGGFTTGSTNSPHYDGQVFAERQDIVVVSINYRLNVFGFPSTPGIPELNLGIHDQRKAMEWVRDNIEVFGGDPKRISLFGQSAGGRAVDIYSFAWAEAKDPIAQGFISESGTAPITTGDKWRPSVWYELSGRLGCGSEEKGIATLACVRKRSMEEIIEASTQRPSIFMQFRPVVDEKVYFGDYRTRVAAGKFIRAPMLVGSNNYEVGLSATIASRQGLANNETYNLITNLGYTCGASNAAQRRVDNNIRVWRYRWMGEWPNQRISPDAGAWHGSEIPHVFGLVQRISESIPATEQQIKVAGLMNSAWAAFAKDPVNGLSELGWPLYNASGNTLVLLAEGNGPGATFTEGRKYDGQCNLIENNNPLGPRMSRS